MTNQSKLAVILHADVVGSTELVQNNEQLAHERIQETFRRFSQTSSDAGGITQELRGDAIVAEFARASDATNAALAFQADNALCIEELDDEIRPALRVGIALGEVVIADNTMTGAGVVLAQRLEQLARPGGVCISAAIREALPGRLSFGYEDLGEQKLKGFERRQRAYAVSFALEGNTPAQSPQPGGARHEVQRASIAILPFDNLSSDPEQEFFADGMAEDIITYLSKFKDLLVIARNTTFTFKGQAVDVADVARKLGVRYVVEGSVRRASSRIRVTVQLVDAASGGHLWGERYDRTLDDIFAVQDEVTEAVITAIAPMVGRAEIERARRTPPASLDAWAQLQLGLSHLWTLREERLSQAQQYLHQAVEIDPRFSVAHGWLAFTLFLRGMLFDYQKERTLSVAEQHAREAIALDSESAVGYVALGRVLTVKGNTDEAVRVCKTAIALNPNLGIAFMGLGFALYYGAGDPEGALPHFEVALRLSPRDPWRFFTHLYIGSVYRALGHYETAIVHGEAACELGDASPLPNLHLAASLGLAGRLGDARRAVDEARRIAPGLSINRLLAGVLKDMHSNSSDSLVAGLRLLGFPEE